MGFHNSSSEAAPAFNNSSSGTAFFLMYHYQMGLFTDLR